MDRNDVIIGQTVNRAVANEIQDGFTLTPMTGNPKLDKDLAARWKDWAEDADQCDLTGERTFWDQEQAVSRAIDVNGDIVALASESGALEMVEAHRMRTPSWKTKNIAHGVEMHPVTGKPLRYWLTKEDLGTGPYTLRINDFQPYEARDEEGNRLVFHCRAPKRITQSRGMPALTPIFDICGMFEDTNFATLLQRQIVSCFLVFRERSIEFSQQLAAAGAAGTVNEELPDGTIRQIEGMGPAREFVGYPGEKLHLDSPNVPNPEFFPHMKLILTLIGINLGLPLVMVLMDASETNFSGWRGAWSRRTWALSASSGTWASASIVRSTCGRTAAGRPAIRPSAGRPAGTASTSSATAGTGRRGPTPCSRSRTPRPTWSGRATRSSRSGGAAPSGAWTGTTSPARSSRTMANSSRRRSLKAEELNKKYKGLNVTWREVASLPTAEGIQIAVRQNEDVAALGSPAA